jgi:septal ring factor EnvC (AmiA/AmiB activator)
MTKKEAFEKIKTLLFGEQKMYDAKLVDGTIVQWEGELSEGTAIMVVAEDGNTIPAPDAVHELEDGTKITTVGGLITAIESKEKEEEGEMKEEMANEFEKMFASHLEAFNSLLEKFSTIENKVAEYELKFSEISNNINDITKNNTEKFNAIVEIVDAISEQPAGEPEPVKNVLFKKKETKSAYDVFASYNEWKKK